uniref:Uncharacterized protein n=1 Tax=Odontella aurita TaxID=265563 RepID=A0A7S4JD02_9STRA|mmetsp:Transcript_43982/g.134000  ORF Transcript_43982/g.134000 Transcript_43982/m.134000 type:complete len:2066 (+) Transcript_43982:2120-8317(+)
MMLPESIQDGSENPFSFEVSGCSSFVQYIADFINGFTSNQVTKEDIWHIVDLAQKYLPIEDADVLAHSASSKELSKESLKGAFDSIITCAGNVTPLARISEIIVQMTLTRLASFRLLRLAKPESIFYNRHSLPQDIISEYFSQEHFSLESLVSRLLHAESTSLNVVQTRTDAFVHSLPTVPLDHSLHEMNQEQLERAKDLVHESLDSLIIEHLHLLKNEISIRTVVEGWASHGSKRILVLVVDMNDLNANNKVNFTRALVEQHATSQSQKVFVMLLHYHASSFQTAPYPALFLGGWQHHFLDGIGHIGQAIKPEVWLRDVCSKTRSGTGTDLDVVPNIAAMLPKALTFAASTDIFYAGQISVKGDRIVTFTERNEALATLMDQSLGESTIGDIVCEKFAAIWTGETLLKTLKRSSDGLLRGTTQLSMSLSLHSVFQETLSVFVCALLRSMTEWRNLDILSNCHASDSANELFAQILRMLPMAPLEELTLQRHIKGGTCAIPPFVTKHSLSAVRFPFFYFVSSFLDTVVETAEARLGLQSPAETAVCSRNERGCEVLSYAVNALDEEEPMDDVSSGAEGLGCKAYVVAKYVIEKVKGAKQDDGNAFLFQQYLSHFILWKFGCQGPAAMQWMSEKVSKLNVAGNILAVHVVAKTHEMDLMRVASSSVLAIQDLANLCDTSDIAAGNVNIQELLPGMLKKFDATLTDLLGPNSDRWTHSVETFLWQITAIAGSEINDAIALSNLRVLAFFHLLARSHAPVDVVKEVMESWQRAKKEESVKEFSSLRKMVAILNVIVASEEDWVDGFIPLVLGRFLSKQWLNFHKEFAYVDTKFVIEFITNGMLSNHHRLAVVLLRNACSSDSKMSTAVPGLSDPGLQTLSSWIQCNGISSFSGDGTRMLVPHYVPHWMVDNEGREKNPLGVPLVSEFSVFFASYEQCYNGPLSGVVFDMVLGQLLQEAESSTSEELLLTLLQDIANECGMKQSEIIRLARIRSCSDEEESSLVGSTVAAMIVDARLLVYVLKVSYELAISSRASALCGQYAEQGHSLLQSAMVLRGFNWQELFFNNIMRVRGEGTVVSLLGEGGALHSLPWCRYWVRGIPSAVQGSENALQEAEGRLAEALQDEERKCREFRRCPHCNRMFAVYAINCGQFVCGRDAHGDVGNGGLQGCGTGFHIGQAPLYTADEGVLAPLRAKVADERAQMHQFSRAVEMLERAKHLHVPLLLHCLEKATPDASLAPTSYLVESLRTSESMNESGATALIKVLMEDHHNDIYSYIPDFIEIYIWLHSTFRFLVTKEQAMSMSMQRMMQVSLLHKRFDSVTTDHILRLWKRTVEGFNMFRQSAHNVVNWDCEEIMLPFETIEEATLMMLLSEGKHPTDGHDYLFLVINTLVDRYNSFARRLNEFNTQGQGNSQERAKVASQDLHPRFLLRGSGGAVAISSISLESTEKLSALVEQCWCDQREGYDPRKLSFAIKEETGLGSDWPQISCPLSFLREMFQFRDDETQSRSAINVEQIAFMSSEGDLFVRPQDLQLFEDVKQGLENLPLADKDQDIRRAIGVHFHDSEYNTLRSLLEGVRTTLGLITPGFAVDSRKLADVFLSSQDHATRELRKFGFPPLSDGKESFILALDMCQLHELVNYLAYQLASEAYLFAKLPLCMTDPLLEDANEALVASFGDACERDGVAEALGNLDEFTKLLSHHERTICEASSNNQSLQAYLHAENLCNVDYFPFFALLPKGIRICNYVALRQLLHQIKLNTLLDNKESDCDKDVVRETTSHAANRHLFSRPTRGQYWLWVAGQGPEALTEECVDSSLYSKLWFEVASLRRSSAQVNSSIQEEPLSDNDSFSDSGKLAIASSEGDAVQHSASSLKRKATNPTKKGTKAAGHDLTTYDREVTMAASVIQKWWRATPRSSLASVHADSKPRNLLVLRKKRRTDQVRRWLVPSFFTLFLCAPLSYQLRKYSINRLRSEDAVGDDKMRHWLNDLRLPSAVADHLSSLGARSMEDVAMLVGSFPELLENLAQLDQLKLKAAVRSIIENNSERATPKASLKRSAEGTGRTVKKQQRTK